VKPIVIDKITWTGTDKNEFTYGDAVNVGFTAYAGSTEYNVFKLVCDKPEDFAKGNVGNYLLTLEWISQSPNFTTTDAVVKSFGFTINPKSLDVVMNSITVLGDEKTAFTVSVVGKDGAKLPAEVLSQIVYKLENGSPFEGMVNYGSSVVVDDWIFC